MTFCQWFPSGISDACMTMASAPTASTLVFLMVKFTGIASSSLVLLQPPAPNASGPPSMRIPIPNCLELCTIISICWSDIEEILSIDSPLVRGTPARITES